jgi:hypothetical protein
MAPWIIHLRIAEENIRSLKFLNTNYFAIGNIAPDSGFRSSIDDEFDPPPFISHYHTQGKARYTIADLGFFRQYLAIYPERDDMLKWKSLSFTPSLSLQKFSFLLGYYFHLVTDNLWFEAIDKPTREKYKKEFDSDPSFIWEVKRDWYGLDLEYVRNYPQSLYWSSFLDAEYKHDFIPFMKPYAIQKRIDEIVELYQRTDDEIEHWYGQRPGKYLTKEEYDMFVLNSSPLVLKCYKLLFEKQISIEESLSILEFIL